MIQIKSTKSVEKQTNLLRDKHLFRINTRSTFKTKLLVIYY